MCIHSAEILTSLLVCPHQRQCTGAQQRTLAGIPELQDHSAWLAAVVEGSLVSDVAEVANVDEGGRVALVVASTDIFGSDAPMTSTRIIAERTGRNKWSLLDETGKNVLGECVSQGKKKVKGVSSLQIMCEDGSVQVCLPHGVVDSTLPSLTGRWSSTTGADDDGADGRREEGGCGQDRRHCGRAPGGARSLGGAGRTEVPPPKAIELSHPRAVVVPSQPPVVNITQLR